MSKNVSQNTVFDELTQTIKHLHMALNQANSIIEKINKENKNLKITIENIEKQLQKK